MSESSIGLNLDGSGKKVRTLKRTVGTDEVHEEVHNVTDGAGNVIDPRDLKPSAIVDPQLTKAVNAIEYAWNGDGTPKTAVYKDVGGAVLFTLTYAWNPDGTLQSITRS